MQTITDPLVQVVSYHGSESGVWIRQSKSLHKVLPFCREHSQMGRWVTKTFSESVGGRAYSPVDSVDVIVCEEC